MGHYDFACNLTSAELQQRKETILQDLKSMLIGKDELEDGYAYILPATDAAIDLLTTFLKVERKCCSFLRFQMNVSQEIVLSITGKAGTKDFILAELGL